MDIRGFNVIDVNSKIVLLKNEDSSYYFKFCSPKGCYKEIIGSMLAKEIEIDSVTYKMDDIDGYVGVISDSFLDSGNFIYMETILRDFYKNSNTTLFNNILDVSRALKSRYGIDFSEELIKIFLFDLLIANHDRHERNYGVIEGKFGVRLAPIFDFGEMLSSTAIYSYGYSLGVDRNDFYLWTDENNYSYAKHFFETYDREWEKYLSLISEDNINKLFSILDIPVEIENELKNKFRDNYLMLSKTLEEVNKEKKKVLL